MDGQVEDPGNASAVAGKNLAQAQLPNYMQSAITSMVNYFSVGQAHYLVRLLEVVLFRRRAVLAADSSGHLARQT